MNLALTALTSDIEWAVREVAKTDMPPHEATIWFRSLTAAIQRGISEASTANSSLN